MASMRRHTAATAKNSESSRSFCDVVVHVESLHPDGRALASQLHLVDMAGSERSAQTNATGERLKEVSLKEGNSTGGGYYYETRLASHIRYDECSTNRFSTAIVGLGCNAQASAINGTLSVLRRVVEARSKRKTEDAVVPYNESKLTRLLKEALSGNGVMLMFFCVSVAATDFRDSLSTLRFAQNCRRLNAAPTVVLSAGHPAILAMKHTMQSLGGPNEQVPPHCVPSPVSVTHLAG